MDYERLLTCNPARVGRKGHVLDAGRRITPVKRVQMVHSTLASATRCRMNAEDVEIVTKAVGCK